jgi:hypothetical protein
MLVAAGRGRLLMMLLPNSLGLPVLWPPQQQHLQQVLAWLTVARV